MMTSFDEACRADYPTVTDEVIKGVVSGNFPDDQNFKCYLFCMSVMSQYVCGHLVDYK